MIHNHKHFGHLQSTPIMPCIHARISSLPNPLLGILVYCISMTSWAQIALPRIVWHPQLEAGVSTSIVDTFRTYPLPEVKGVQFCIWTLSYMPWHADCIQYVDIPGLINDGYVIGTFIYNNVYEINEVVNTQIVSMGARIVIADELAWRQNQAATPQEIIDMSDACHEANPDVLFVYSDVSFSGSWPIYPICEQMKSLLAQEVPARDLADVIDVLVSQSWSDGHILRFYAAPQGIKSSVWASSVYPRTHFRCAIRCGYHTLSAAFIFHRPNNYGWNGTNGMREELLNMLRSRFIITSSGIDPSTVIDSMGYITTRSGCYINATTEQLTPSSDREFIVRNGSVVLALIDETGVYLKGKLYQLVTVNLNQVTSIPCMRVRDPAGTTVAMINSQEFINSAIEPTSPYVVPAGSLLLKQEIVH